MLLERATLTTLLLSSTVAGMSFARLQADRLAARFRAAGLTSHRARLPSGEVHYWAGGTARGADKTPLLLVHGFGADALWGWAHQSDLARDHFLICPDLLWFGQSHAPIADFSTIFQARVLVELLDHLAIDAVHVAGISYGGFVTLELAALHPERTRKVVLIDSPGHTFTLDDYRDLLDRFDVDSVSEIVVPEKPEGVRRLLQLAYHRPPPVPLFVARDIYAHIFVTHRAQKVRLLDDHRLRQDTLVLWGAHDVLFPAPLAWRLADALGPRASVQLIPATNHAPNLERPALFNRMLRNFIG